MSRRGCHAAARCAARMAVGVSTHVRICVAWLGTSAPPVNTSLRPSSSSLACAWDVPLRRVRILRQVDVGGVRQPHRQGARTRTAGGGAACSRRLARAPPALHVAQGRPLASWPAAAHRALRAVGGCARAARCAGRTSVAVSATSVHALVHAITRPQALRPYAAEDRCKCGPNGNPAVRGAAARRHSCANAQPLNASASRCGAHRTRSARSALASPSDARSRMACTPLYE
jgi:hypothetical protein